jgi:hypothetical protein
MKAFRNGDYALSKTDIKRATPLACKLISEARKLIAAPNAWIKGHYTSSVYRRVGGEERAYQAFCMVGALRHVETAARAADEHDPEKFRPAVLLVRHALANAIRREAGVEETPRPNMGEDEAIIINYNDAKSRRKPEVVGRMDEAASEVCPE